MRAAKWRYPWGCSLLIEVRGVNAVSRWTGALLPINGQPMGSRSLFVVVLCAVLGMSAAAHAQSDAALRGPAPASSPASWIRPNDYPVEAIRNGDEGTVGFTLDVDEAGAVINCQVSQSSGSEVLDMTTCDLMRMRATFRSALDGEGNAVRGRYASRVRWEIPRERTPPEEGVVTGTFVVETDGHVRDCRLIAFQSAALRKLKGEAASSLREFTERSFCLAQAYYQPYREEDGRPVSKRVTMSQSIRTETLGN